VTSLQKFISRFILIDEAIVFSRQPHASTKKRLFKKTHSQNHATKSSRLMTYLNVDAFETTFLLAQGYTTLSLFMSFLLSRDIVFFDMTPLSDRQIAGTALSSILWLLTSFVSISIAASILRDGLNYRVREDASVMVSFSGMAFELYLLYLFSWLFLHVLALNPDNVSLILSISTAAIILYGCSKSVLFVATVISCICQTIVIKISGWSIPGFLALSILWAALYKFARAHGMGPLLPTVQTRRFSWGYFISAHMAAPILLFGISRTAGVYYLILLVFVLLPLINSIMDWLSISITRYLMDEIKTKAKSIRALLVYLLIDAVVAILLFFVTLLLVLTLFVFNNGMHAGLDNPMLIPIASILDSLKKNPLAPEIAWLTFLLTMTVVPTLLHYLIVWFSIGIWTTGQIMAAIDRRFGLRLWIDQISGEVDWDKLQAAASLHTAMLLTIVWFVGVGLLVILLALEVLIGAGAEAAWRMAIDAARYYCDWLAKS
jgi:hypothetical protein